MIDMKGKVAVILGVANKRSIAYAIAEKLAGAGATLVLSYQTERLKKASEELLESLGQASTGLLVECDVASDDAITAAFAQSKTKFPEIHTLVHSVGFAPNIKNPVLDTARADFAVANDISVYSLIAIARVAVPMMPEGSSILTLTYYGAEKVFPNYNIMGATSPTNSARRRSASMPSPPAPSIRWPRAASATLLPSSTRSPTAPRCTATSSRRRSVTPRSSSPATSPAASRAK
jgi:enoyl-[acyl-carrier protein] reductase I